MFGISDKKLLKKMNDVIDYRGPNDSGFYIDDHVGLGNRRLSIIDLKKGKQPIHNEDKNIWITFNGEIYNFNELKDDLAGHKFYTNTDTEAIIHCYEKYGLDFVNKLNGMFAFALWDSKKKVLILARDRLGIKPLYYTISDDKLFFGSEIKTILQNDEIKKEINPQSMFDYLSFRYVPGNETMMKNIYRLEPGHMLICRFVRGKISLEKKMYWTLNFETRKNTEEFYKEKIKNNLEDSVRLRLVSDVPIGAYLSGGIDSSAVVAFMSKHMDETVETFTVGFGEENDELKYAKMVSERFGTKHRELMVDVNNVPGELKKIVWHLDEPVADPAAIPTYFMSNLTKKYVTVLLTGEGADEQFGGYYQRYSLMSKRFLPFKKMIYKRISSTFTDSAKRSATKRPFPSGTKTKLKFIRAEIPSYRFEMCDWLPNDLLLKVDRMTMAHSLEARVPFLDHRSVEFNMSIPMKFKIKNKDEKYILKRALRGTIPDEIISRKKHSFSVPIHNWVRKEDMIAPLYNSEFFKRDYIESVKNKKPRQLYSMLILDLWHRVFIRGEKL